MCSFAPQFGIVGSDMQKDRHSSMSFRRESSLSDGDKDRRSHTVHYFFGVSAGDAGACVGGVGCMGVMGVMGAGFRPRSS